MFLKLGWHVSDQNLVKCTHGQFPSIQNHRQSKSTKLKRSLGKGSLAVKIEPIVFNNVLD